MDKHDHAFIRAMAEGAAADRCAAGNAGHDVGWYADIYERRLLSILGTAVDDAATVAKGAAARPLQSSLPL